MTAGYENLASQISSYINTIQEDAFWLGLNSSVMVNLAWKPSDVVRGIADRKFWSYTQSAMSVYGEAEEIQSAQFVPEAGNTITPTRKGLSHFISRARWESEPNDVLAEATRNLGFAAAAAEDEALVDLFASLTGGTIGAAGSTLAWGHMTAANAILKVQLGNMPYRHASALHPYQWNDLAKSASIATANVAAAPDYTNAITRQYFVNSVFGIDFFEDANIDIDSEDDAKGALLVPGETLAFDPRMGGLRLSVKDKPEKDGVEIIGNYWFGVGVRKPTWGVQIYSDASTPTS